MRESEIEMHHMLSSDVLQAPISAQRTCFCRTYLVRAHLVPVALSRCFMIRARMK